MHLYKEMRMYQSEVLLFYFTLFVTNKVTAHSETFRKCLNISFIGGSVIRNVDHLYLRTLLAYICNHRATWSRLCRNIGQTDHLKLTVRTATQNVIPWRLQELNAGCALANTRTDLTMKSAEKLVSFNSFYFASSLCILVERILQNIFWEMYHSLMDALRYTKQLRNLGRMYSLKNIADLRVTLVP
jgi:hypothetical protein